MPVTLPTVRSVFNRVDTSGDNAISRDEVESFVRAAGVGSGFLGGSKVSAAVDGFMDKFAQGGQDTVSYAQFAARAQALIPGAARNATAAQIQANANKLFKDADANDDGDITEGELVDAVKKELDARGAFMAGTKAEVGAKLAMHMLDADGAGRVSKAQIMGLADDVVAQLGLAAANSANT